MLKIALPASEDRTITGSKAWIRTVAGRLVLLLTFLAIGLSAAEADVCSALRAQIGSSGSSAQLAPLTRQLAAIGGLQRQRRCGGVLGGLFSACRDLASRRADVQRQIQSISRSSRGGAILARLQDLGCGAAPSRRALVRTEQARTTGSFGSTAMLFCVRPSDGYFFPAPHSQFTAKQDLKTTQDMCRYICDDPSVDVYTLGDVSLETEEMASVETHKKYLELPTAFDYRENAEFRACDLQRYYRRVDEARARTVTPNDMANANIAVPTPKPEVPTGGEAISGLTAYATEAPAQPMPDRKIRQVGSAFFPPQ